MKHIGVIGASGMMGHRHRAREVHAFAPVLKGREPARGIDAERGHAVGQRVVRLQLAVARIEEAPRRVHQDLGAALLAGVVGGRGGNALTLLRYMAGGRVVTVAGDRTLQFVDDVEQLALRMQRNVPTLPLQ